MNLEVKKINEDAILPVRAHATDAGLDLFSSVDLEVESGDRVKVSTGISMAIPVGHAGLIWDKSGLSFNEGIKVLGGVIDSDYRGEIIVSIANISKINYKIKKGQKIAQMLIQKVELMEVKEVSSLTNTERGTGGFGSTGN